MNAAPRLRAGPPAAPSKNWLNPKTPADGAAMALLFDEAVTGVKPWAGLKSSRGVNGEPWNEPSLPSSPRSMSTPNSSKKL